MNSLNKEIEKAKGKVDELNTALEAAEGRELARKFETQVKNLKDANASLEKNLIIEKINSYFGYDAVQGIRLVSFEEKNDQYKEKYGSNDVTINKYKKQISDIKNEKIRNSLTALSKVYKKK